MSKTRNFVATVKEPVGGFAVQLEFHEEIEGISGDTIVIHLKDGTSLDTARSVANTLNTHGQQVIVD